MNDRFEIPKGYFILLLALFIFTMWGVNLFSLSDIEVTETVTGTRDPGMVPSGGGVSTVTFKPRPFLSFYLQEIGFRVEIDQHLPRPKEALLVLVAPPDRMPSQQSRRIVDWVARGGNLVVFLPRPHPVGAYLGATVETHQGPIYEQLSMRLPYIEEVRSLSESGNWAHVSPGMAFLRPFANELARPTVLTTFRGEGQIVLVTNPDFLTPDGLGRADNLVYLTRLFEHLSPRRHACFYDPEPNVLYRARVRSSGAAPTHTITRKKKVPHLSLWSLIKANPISWALPQLAFALWLYFYSRGRRFGRPLPLPEGEAEPLPTFIQGMGRLLRERDDRAFLARRILDGFLTLVGRRFGLPPERERIPDLLERVKAEAPALLPRLEPALRDLQRTESGFPLADPRLLAHINSLDFIRKELRIHG